MNAPVARWPRTSILLRGAVCLCSRLRSILTNMVGKMGMQRRAGASVALDGAVPRPIMWRSSGAPAIVLILVSCIVCSATSCSDAIRNGSPHRLLNCLLRNINKLKCPANDIASRQNWDVGGCWARGKGCFVRSGYAGRSPVDGHASRETHREQRRLAASAVGVRMCSPPGEK